MIEMRVVGVRIELPQQQPVLVLTEVEGERSIPIMIGGAEATAIAMVMQGVTLPRPMTHDLFKDSLVALGHRLAEVHVVDFREGTFYGELVFDSGVTVSARPSDAIALALRWDASVYVSEDVMEEIGVILPTPDPDADGAQDGAGPVADPEGELERFREFLDSVSPEDFGPEESQ